MSDKEARALGAADVLTVDGVEYKILPVGMRALHELQREAVKFYKRQYLQTFADNLDLLSEEQASDLMSKKMEEVARWDVGDLPSKPAYDVRKVPLSPKLLEALEKEFGELPNNDAGKSALLSTALDSGTILPELVKTLSGTRPRQVRIPYDTWWVTGVFQGIISFVWTSVKESHPEVTKEQVAGWPFIKLAEAARILEQITAPDLGNTSGSLS